jgi:predicted PurR-regulated permease PerM
MSRNRLPDAASGGSLFFAVVIVLLFVLGKTILVPLAFALTVSLLLAPAVARLESWRFRREIAVAAVMIVTASIFVAAAYVISRQVVSIAGTLPGYRSNIQSRLVALHSPTVSSLKKGLASMEDLGEDLTRSSVSNTPEGVPVQLVQPRNEKLRSAGGLVMEGARWLGGFAIVLVFAIYMLMNRSDLRHRLLLLAGMAKINLMTRALDDATRRISQYFVMQVKVNACYGLAFGLGLHLLHVPNATLWGVLAGVLRIIPFVGTAVGMLLPLLLSIAVSTSWWPPLFVIVLFLILEVTVTNFIEPWIFSSRTGISSLALLSSAIFWTMLWGWPGLVLSTPLTVCLVVLGRHVPQMSFLHSLLGSNVQLSPAAHFYERLLASDKLEAKAIAEKYLDGKPLVDLYDDVLVPALSLAEEDRHAGAMDPVRSGFILLNIGELVATLSGYRQKEPIVEEKSSRSRIIEAHQMPPLKEFAVVCISSRDPADELTTEMLTQLLEREDFQTITLKPDGLSPDVLERLAAEKDTVVFISAVPPFSFAPAREFCKVVRTYMPENRIAVAFWNTFEDSDEVVERFGTARPDVVVGTLKQAIKQVGMWRQATRKS